MKQVREIFSMVVVLAILFASCEKISSPLSENGLLAIATTQGIQIQNFSGDRLYYQTFLAEDLPYINFAACGPGCPSVGIGRTELIDYEDISGYQDGDEVALVWYHLQRTGATWKITRNNTVFVATGG